MIYTLGSRILWSARAWAAIVSWTFAYSDGAGFGAIIYQNDCHGSPLFYQPVFPPDVSIGSFLSTAGTIWVNGLYQSGITLGFLLLAVVMIGGSRLTGLALEKVLSIPLISIVAALAAPLGYLVTVHATLTSGNSPCAL